MVFQNQLCLLILNTPLLSSIVTAVDCSRWKSPLRFRWCLTWCVAWLPASWPRWVVSSLPLLRRVAWPHGCRPSCCSYWSRLRPGQICRPCLCLPVDRRIAWSVSCERPAEISEMKTKLIINVDVDENLDVQLKQWLNFISKLNQIFNKLKSIELCRSRNKNQNRQYHKLIAPSLLTAFRY